jgi:hypothetical protein
VSSTVTPGGRIEAEGKLPGPNPAAVGHSSCIHSPTTPTKTPVSLLAAAFAGLLPSTLPAAFIQTGQGYSYEVSSVLPGAEALNFGIFTFNIPSFAENSQAGVRTYSNHVAVTFRADPGKVIDTATFSGNGGAFNNFGGNSGNSRYDWTLSTGAYSGAVGPNTGTDTAYNRYAEITGPRSGTLLHGAHFWSHYGAYDFNDPFIIPGHFDIGVSEVSLDVSMFGVSNHGGYFASQALRVVVAVTDAPAPPPTSVPDTGTTATLMALGLVGLAATRRRLSPA